MQQSPTQVRLVAEKIRTHQKLYPRITWRMELRHITAYSERALRVVEYLRL